MCSLGKVVTCAGDWIISMMWQSRKTIAGFYPDTCAVSWSEAAPLLDLRIEGDPEATFTLVSDSPRATDALLPALEVYSEESTRIG